MTDTGGSGAASPKPNGLRYAARWASHSGARIASIPNRSCRILRQAVSKRLAIDLHIPHSRVTAIIRGRRSITPDTALRLSRYFGTSAEFWFGLQNEYDLRKARAESGAVISSEVHPLAV